MPLGHWQRIATYTQLADLVRGARVVELDVSDDKGRRFLLERGAREVEQRATGAAPAPVVLALDVAAAQLPAVLDEAVRLAGEDGVVVVGCESRDRPGATGGVSYYELLGLVEARFPTVTMVGMAPFFGAALVEYGVADPEPTIDGTLLPKGERVGRYLAIGTRQAHRRLGVGWALVQLPAEAIEAKQAEVKPLPAKPEPPKPEPPKPAPVVAPSPDLTELETRLATREKALIEFQDAAKRHADEMRRVATELQERDAYIAELSADAQEGAAVREQLRLAEQRALGAELRERQAKLALAQAEGRLVKAEKMLLTQPRPAAQVVVPVAAPPPPPPIAPLPITPAGEGGDRVAALEAENALLRKREEEARAESWKHLKSRSDVEAQLAELRDDTVRKLKDARKLASVELTRAMESATHKAVSLREDLSRSDKERKELSARIAELEAQLGGAAPPPSESGVPRRDLARAREEGDAAVLAAQALAARSLQDEIAARRAAEDRVRAADEQADELRHRVQILERELDERGRDLALERRAAETERQHNDALVAELEAARTPSAPVEQVRFAELSLELEKREAAVEAAMASANHERARAERLVAEERRASAERHELRARIGELETRLDDAARERNEIELKARRALDEAEDRRERAQRLVAQLDEAAERALSDQAREVSLREQLRGLEAAVRAEAERVAALEASLRARRPT
jgi:hypothetical protein